MKKKDENTNELGRLGHFAGRLLWVCIVLAAITLVVLAVYGLCVTAVALDRNEAWAKWVAAPLFLLAFLLILQEMQR